MVAALHGDAALLCSSNHSDSHLSFTLVRDDKRHGRCTLVTVPTCLRQEETVCPSAADVLSRQQSSLGTSTSSADANIARCPVPVFELAAGNNMPTVGQLLLHRPVAALALVPKPVVLFTAGALAGAIGAAPAASPRPSQQSQLLEPANLRRKIGAAKTHLSRNLLITQHKSSLKGSTVLLSKILSWCMHLLHRC